MPHRLAAYAVTAAVGLALYGAPTLSAFADTLPVVGPPACNGAVAADPSVAAAQKALKNAQDSDDCRELLDMLGLIGEPGEPPPVRR